MLDILYLFINLLFVTFVVSFFTFFPYWNSTPISFYYFTDYLCFYGVLVFLLFTTMTKNKYYLLFSFLLLGTYFSILNNRAAILFWITTLLAGIIYYSLKALNNYYENKKLRKFLFSEGMLVFVVFLISFLVLFCSIYFWSTDFNLPPNIKDTIIDAPVVRVKIIENSLHGLSSLKLFLFGNGWGTVSDLLLQSFEENNIRVFEEKEFDFGCSCSIDKVKQTMSIYSVKEIDLMTNDLGKVTADCQFCGAKYILSPSELGYRN